MSVEQALAAREAIVGEAQEQVANMEASREDDPFTVDLEILTQQKALAERAAVLNTRAQKMQQLSQANEQRKPSVNDPTTAHNLSIVSPREFIRVPGVQRAAPKSGATPPPQPAVAEAAVPIGALREPVVAGTVVVAQMSPHRSPR